MTPFCFEHDFVAPSTAAVFAAYFDPELQIEIDRALAISVRETLELHDRGDELLRVCRVVPKRQLPALVRPFSSAPLHYIERVLWRRAADEIAVDMRLPRAQIRATYRLERSFPGAKTIRRRYTGEVSVDVALVSARIERGIVAEFERSVPLAAACTQNWLDSLSVTARA